MIIIISYFDITFFVSPNKWQDYLESWNVCLLALQMVWNWASVTADQIATFFTTVTIVMVYRFSMFLEFFWSSALSSCSIFTNRRGYQSLNFLQAMETLLLYKYKFIEYEVKTQISNWTVGCSFCHCQMSTTKLFWRRKCAQEVYKGNLQSCQLLHLP